MKVTFQQILPANARGKFDESLWLNDEWWAEKKYDGDRRIVQFVQGKGRFTGRRISVGDGLFVEKTDNVPHLNGTHDGLDLKLMGTVLDGEMLCPWKGARSRDVTSIMGSAPEKAIKKQEERGWLRFVGFDCLFWRGKDLREEPLIERRKYLLDAIDIWDNEHVKKAVRVDEEKEAFLRRIWEDGGEGIILKDINSPYVPGDDNKHWVKVKKVETHDVVIMGYEDAKKESTKVSGLTSATKYHAKGWIGAVRFGQYVDGKLTYMGKCSGMDDKLREELSKNPKKHLNRVVEIKVQEREADSGKFRHPRWEGFRDDKNPKDCKWVVP